MYSQEEVQEILDGLRGCVVTNLRQEVHITNTLAAYGRGRPLADLYENNCAVVTLKREENHTVL